MAWDGESQDRRIEYDYKAPGWAGLWLRTVRSGCGGTPLWRLSFRLSDTCTTRADKCAGGDAWSDGSQRSVKLGLPGVTGVGLWNAGRPGRPWCEDIYVSTIPTRMDWHRVWDGWHGLWVQHTTIAVKDSERRMIAVKDLERRMI